MRGRWPSLLAVLVLSLVAFAPAGASPSTPPAGSFSVENLTSFTVYGDHVYFTTIDFYDDPDGTLHRANLDGSDISVVSTIGNDSVRSPDGSTLWLSGGTYLAAFELATETLTPYVPASPLGAEPRHMAASSSYVWFMDGSDQFTIGVLDLSDGSYHVMDAIGAPTSLHTDPGDPRAVLLSDGLSLSAGSITRATLTDSWTLSQGATTFLKGLWPDSIAWSTDGSRLFTGDGRVLRSSDLHVLERDYPYGNVVSDGQGRLAHVNDGTVALTDESSPTVDKSITLPAPLYESFGALFQDGSLMVLVTDNDRSTYALRTIDTRPEVPLTLQLARDVYSYRAPIDIGVKLGAASTNRDVTITVTQKGLPTESWTVTVPKSSESAVLTRRLSYNAIITASSTGDTDHEGVTRRSAVKIRTKVTLRPVNALRKSGKYFLFKLSKRATFAGEVLPVYRDACHRYPTYALIHGQWNYVGGDVCVRTGNSSRSRITLRGKGSIVGVPLQTQMTWGSSGDLRNKWTRSNVVFWKFVR